MSDLTKLTIAAARGALRSGETTALELTEACLAEIEKAGALNAFVHHTPDLALDRARAADDRLKAGDAPSMCAMTSAASRWRMRLSAMTRNWSRSSKASSAAMG